MTLQQEVIKRLRCKPEINVEEEIRLTINFLKDYIKKNNFIKSLVLGISGGQDSTLCGKLCQMAITELREETGEEYNFIAVRLPYGQQFDEADCNDALKFINPDKVFTVNIKDAVDASVNSLKVAGVEITDFAKGNEKARERMKTQYSIATMNKGIVVGTDHAAEAIAGFFTKYSTPFSSYWLIQAISGLRGSKVPKPPAIATALPFTWVPLSVVTIKVSSACFSRVTAVSDRVNSGWNCLICSIRLSISSPAPTLG